MRIDFVITELYVGGAERCLTELAIGLAESGDAVRVLSIGSLPPEGPQRALIQRLASAGIDVQTTGADSQLQFPGSFRQIRNWLEESTPDLCQTFLFHANVLGTLAAKSVGVPCRVGGLRVVDDRWRRRVGNKFVAKKMDQVVCVSDEVADYAQRRLGFAASQTVMIPNGVQIQRFRSAEPFVWTKLGWTRDSKVALFVGRLHPQKGIDLLQDQIDDLAPAGSNQRLLIVGQGPLREALEQWAARIGHQRVQLLPWQADIAPLMRACRLLVLPSRYEGMPNVVLEAMAAARPVVCSKVQGIGQLLGHDSDHQTFPSGDSNQMKTLVQRFMSDETLYESIGGRNQQRAASDFSVSAMVDRYRALYRTLRTNRLDGV